MIVPLSRHAARLTASCCAEPIDTTLSEYYSSGEKCGYRYYQPRRRATLVQGFTLLEMLLVLSIAVFAMVLVVPNFSKGLGSVQLSGASREIASSLRYLRGHAVSKNTEAEFNVDVGTNVYRISGKKKDYSVPKAINIRLVTADSEITGEDSGTIRFFPDGSSTGGRVTLEVGNKKRIVDVNWLTGHVETFTEVVE